MASYEERILRRTVLLIWKKVPLSLTSSLEAIVADSARARLFQLCQSARSPVSP